MYLAKCIICFFIITNSRLDATVYTVHYKWLPLNGPVDNGSKQATFIVAETTNALHSSTVYYTIAMALLLLALLSCMGYVCCQRRCRRSLQLPPTHGLDAYAPRSRSILWPPLPLVTARVLELTFLHEPNASDCICQGCLAARQKRRITLEGTPSTTSNVLCIENCLGDSEC